VLWIELFSKIPKIKLLEILNTYFIERNDYNDEKNELQFEGKA
jgi:hypothetical protein